MRNTTPGTGNWLDVQVQLGTNTSGIGSRVRIYRLLCAAGRADALLGTAEITTGNGFSSVENPGLAHFGLGTNTAVDVEVVPPFGAPAIRRTASPPQLDGRGRNLGPERRRGRESAPHDAISPSRSSQRLMPSYES